MVQSWFLVTIKLKSDPLHNPQHKVTGPCPVSGSCSDATGAHHTVLARSQEEVDQLRSQFPHITRVEEVFT